MTVMWRTPISANAQIDPDCAEPVIGRRFAPTPWLHPGLYGDMVVKRRDRSRHAFSSVVGIEREVLVMVLSFRWLIAAPGAAAVKAGHRPPPEAARSGLDGGEAGARLSDRNVSVRAVSGVTRRPGLGRDVVMRKTPHQLVSGRVW